MAVVPSLRTLESQLDQVHRELKAALKRGDNQKAVQRLVNKYLKQVEGFYAVKAGGQAGKPAAGTTSAPGKPTKPAPGGKNFIVPCGHVDSN